MSPDDFEERPKYADVIDVANQLLEDTVNDTVKLMQVNREKAPKDFDGQHCIDCGELIHPVRLAHGFFRDTWCQTKKEKKDNERR